MKRLVAILSIILLTSCIEVGDLNTPYIAAHVVADTRLLGKWRKLKEVPGHPAEEVGPPLNVTEKDRVFTYKEVNTQLRSPVYFDSGSFWTMKIDNHYFAIAPELRVMFRYKIEDNLLYLYTLDVSEAAAYVKARYPKYRDTIFRNPAGKWKGRNLSFDSLTEDTAKVLVDMARKPDLWTTFNIYRRFNGFMK